MGFWDEETHIGECEGARNKEFRVGVNERNKKVYVSVKEWFSREEEEEFFPSKNQGINFPEECIDDVIELLLKARANLDSEDEEKAGEVWQKIKEELGR